jgi:hypothetical protein
MGWFSKLFGGGAKDVGEAAKSTFEGVGSFSRDLRTAFTGKLDPQLAAEMQTRLAELDNVLATGQQEIAKLEAQHPSVLVAGWRPAIGWVAAMALFAFFVPQFVVGSWVWARECFAALEGQQPLPEYPVSAAGLMELVLALLGMGALRTAEKFRGVQDRH